MDHEGAEDDPPAPTPVGRRGQTCVVVIVSVGTLIRRGMCHLDWSSRQPFLISRQQQSVPATRRQQSTPTIALNPARAWWLPTTTQSCRWWRLSRLRFGREVDGHDLSQIRDGSQIHAGVRRAPRAGGFCWIGCAGQTRRKAHVQLQADDDPLESYQNILSVTHQVVCLLSLNDYIWGKCRFNIQIIINVIDFFTSVSI